jgi:ribosome biogenesis GTPase A
LLPGGRLNHQKAAESVLNDFRMGVLGRITLETPEDFARWRAAGQAAEQALIQARQAKLQARKPSSSRSRKPEFND